VGLVVDADPPNDGATATRPARVQVKEPFQGLAAETEEVLVWTQGSWLKKGATYLIDAYKRSDGLLEPGLCGATEETESTDARKLLEYLRNRKSGQATTSLHVQIANEHKPVPDVEVTITSSKRSFTTKTDHDGIAYFKNVEPGAYHVQASREFYRLDQMLTQAQEVEVMYGSCPGLFLWMHAQGDVRGLVRDERGTPVSGLPVELREIEEPSRSNDGWFQSKTDDQGNFHFESVSPGWYYLGTNLAGYQKVAPIPRIYYPGRRDPLGAIPIEVTLGGALDNVLFTIPYFGKPREIRLVAVDEEGQPLKGASLTNKIDGKDWDIGALSGLPSDERGLLVTTGFEGVHYTVGVSLPGRELRDLRASDSLDIPPGKGPVQAVLVLKSVFSRPKVAKP